jgi:HYR domain-containing protein
MMRLSGLVVFAAGLATVAGIAASPVAGVTTASGTLSMNTSLTLASQFASCGSNTDATGCDARTDDGLFPGLGSVTASYTFPWVEGTPCPADFGKALAYTVQLEVAGKGAINVSVSDATDCVLAGESIGTQTQSFTITGGTRIYAGASGSGTLARGLGGISQDGSRHGYETWQGTLTVPGLSFDLVPPKIIGATSRTIVLRRHTKKVRVSYVVTATDDVDGPVPVMCKPRSGHRFHIGRTTVLCSATDTSGNLAKARFRITVRRRHH